MNKNKGQSLIEILLAITIFITGVAAVSSLFLSSHISSSQSAERAQAIFLAKEGIEAVRAIRDFNFENLTNGAYGIELVGGKWQTTGDWPDTTEDKFERTIEIGDVQEGVKIITSTVEWQSISGARSVSFNEHLTDWRSESEEE